VGGEESGSNSVPGGKMEEKPSFSPVSCRGGEEGRRRGGEFISSVLKEDEGKERSTTTTS